MWMLRRWRMATRASAELSVSWRLRRIPCWASRSTRWTRSGPKYRDSGNRAWKHQTLVAGSSRASHPILSLFKKRKQKEKIPLSLRWRPRITSSSLPLSVYTRPRTRPSHPYITHTHTPTRLSLAAAAHTHSTERSRTRSQITQRTAGATTAAAILAFIQFPPVAIQLAHDPSIETHADHSSRATCY